MMPFRTQSGFSLVEMVVYVALLSIILLAVVGVVFSFTKSYEELGAFRAAEHSGLAGMERMVREIHLAAAVDTANSVLGTSPGELVLVNNATTTRFYVVDGELRIVVNDVEIGPLSVEKGTITSLIFRHIVAEEAEGVRIDMTIEGEVGSAVKTKSFHTTAILKNS